jgi:hypothetical protein
VPFHPLGVTGFRNGGFPTGIKGGDVATVFTYLVERLHAEAEPMLSDPISGQLGYGCWSYEYRANVNNPSQLSCHASGTAIDYNAPRHPNGTSVASGRSGWSIRSVSAVRAILADLGGVVRWLDGNDPMHFEIHGTAAQVAAVAARLRRIPGQVNDNPAEPAEPTPPPAPTVEDDMFTDENGKALDLAAQGAWTYRLVRDSDDPTGTTYAFAPGVFYWVVSDNDLALMRQAKIVSPDDGDIFVVNHDLVGLIRQEMGRGVEALRDLPPKPAEPETAWYVVQPGDSLSGIAKQYGVPDWHSIADLNGITDPQSIQPGQKIRVK